MGISIDPATLPERLRQFAKFSTEMAIAGKTSGPKELVTQSDAFSTLSKNASDLVVEFALVTRGAAPDGIEGLKSASRAASMLYVNAVSVANDGVGRLNNVYLDGVANRGAPAALSAAKWLEDNPDMMTKFGTELVKTGSAKGEILDVSKVTGRVLGALARGAQDSVVVSGRSGAGRTTIIQDLAQQLRDGAVPPSIREARVIGLDTGRFRADTADPVALSKRLKETLDSAYDFDQEAIVVVDDLDLLQDSIDAALIIRNAIQDSGGKLRVVAFTSDTKAPFVLDDKRLSSFAQHVALPNTTLDRARDILDTKWGTIEAATGIAPADESVTRAVTALAQSYLGGRSRDLAGLSVDVARGAAGRVAAEMFGTPRPIIALEERIAGLEKQITRYAPKTSDIAKGRLATAKEELATAQDELKSLKARWDAEKPIVRRISDADRSIVKLKAGSAKDAKAQIEAATKLRDDARAELATLRGGQPGVIADRLDADAVIRYISEESGVPVDSISWDASEKFEHMLPTMQKSLVGQDHLLEAFTAPVQTWKAGGKDPDRAVSVLAVGGPSQVGKTEGAYVLADFLTGSRENLDVVVGGSYADPSSRNALVGAPSGYRDSEIGGALTQPARLRPHGVTLWDEANKSHPDLFDTILEVGNSGNVADGMGRPVSFRERFVIIAGNWLRDDVDAVRMDWEKLAPAERQEWKDKLRAAMAAQGIKPEVLNRVTDYVVVNSVNDRMVRGVANIYLDNVRKLMAPMNIEVEVKPEVIEHLVAQGNVPGLGGGHVKKLVTAQIKDLIMSKKITGEIKADDIVTVSMKDVDGTPSIGLDIQHL